MHAIRQRSSGPCFVRLWALPLALLLAAPLGQAVTLIDYGATWKMWRGNKTPTRPDYWAWLKPDHDDSEWETAPTPVFFGENVTGGTELDDMKSRYSSFFLRRKFDAPNPDTITSMTLRAKVDDGFVAYINGTEVARHNVDVDKPKYNSAASKAASEPLRFRNYSLKNLDEILIDGENTIAVIVLNLRRTSTDVLFDARLTAISVESVPPKVETVDPPHGLASDLGQISVTFSEPVNGVDATDLRANGQSAQSVEGSGRTWVFQLADLPQGKVNLTWAKNHGITDQAQTPNTLLETANGNRWTYTHADNNPPYVRRTNPPAGLTVKSLDMVGVEFSMPVSGVDADDLLINGTPAKSLTKISDSHYRFVLGQAPGGEVKIAWDLYHNITGTNPFKKTFLPLGWFYHVDANAPPPPRIVISEIMCHPVE